MAIPQNPPALPPRPNIGSSEHTEFSRLGKTPPAWLYSLIHYNFEDEKHQHEFHLSEAFDSEVETVFLCEKCHNWFHLTTTASNTNGNLDEACVFNSENNLHHFHTTTMSKTSISAYCCLCKFAVNIDIREPFIDMRLFNDLSKLRRHTHSYANVVKHTEFEFKTSLVDVINNMKRIVDNVLDDDQYSLKINCEDFEMDRVSQAFFEKLGFTYVSDCLIPPDISSDDEVQNFKFAKEELTMVSFQLSSSSYKIGPKKLYEKLNTILGTTYKSRFNNTCTNFDPSGTRSLQSSCVILGCMPDMDDQILIWAYRQGIQDAPERTSEYLQAIYEMSKERKSESLEELVALEHSLGRFSEEDIKEAYKCFETGDAAVSEATDDYLINAFVAMTTDNPQSRVKYRDSLRIIGKVRDSAKILCYVNEEPVNETYGFFSEMPVGLDNIGNTCYLNSLLQYYFTIRHLRDAVLVTDSGANGHELDWQSVTIGHRKVSKSEIERAKKFVTLLRGLFSNLIHTSQKSISPDIDLAYLALVNAKSDEDEYKENSNSPMDLSSTSYDNKMAIDDSSPGPSSSKIIDNESNTISEEEIVEMEGTAAPPADTKNEENFYQQNNELNASHSLKGKEKENNQTYGPEMPPDFFNTTKEDKLKAASDMLLGRQQDVTECMDNVMFQLEAAFKSPFMIDENGDEQNIIKSLFYGQTRQILHKEQGEPLTKEESFNHLIVVASEGRDLYDGLDVYFDASLVEYDGTQATREVTITKIPPILQIHVQRVQFDRSTFNVYKSNAFLRFDKVIYLDRYLDKNYELLKQRREEAHRWKQDIDRLQAGLKDYERDKITMLSASDLLKSTADFIHDMKNDLTDEDFDWLSVVEQESSRVNVEIEECRSTISQLRSRLRQNYQDLQECEYRLHAVFIHSGQANFGHYWIYIYDFEKDRWLKFNDSYVTEVEEHVVFADTTGSSANPYCMVYVRARDAKELVETVCRNNS